MPPTARTEKLTIQELADETLVFDHEAGKAHCLNQTAALVWKHCNGRTSPADLAQWLGIAEASVELALEQLHRRRLLKGSVEAVQGEARRSRRDALRKLAAAAAMLPAIMTISVPAAMAQASPTNACAGLMDGDSCGTGMQCCGGNCITPGGQGSACTVNCECGGGLFCGVEIWSCGGPSPCCLAL